MTRARHTGEHTGLDRELARFFRQNPGSSSGLVRQHTNDGTGHCTLCTAGGQTGRLIWPCQIYRAAHHDTTAHPAD